MTDEVGFPRVQSHLPELMGFVSGLVDDYGAGKLDSWEALDGRTQAFFTPERMDQVEALAPGWREMSSYDRCRTLVHVMCAFIGLLTSPEYARVTLAQREEMHWIILLHDLAKWVRQGTPDRTHAFRSAALAGAILPNAGFPVTDAYQRGYEAWAALVRGAVRIPPEDPNRNPVQDNRCLPEIVGGIESLLGRDTPAARIVQTILLHTSITVIAEWPQAAPLDEADEKRYLSRALYPLLKMMMLADNDGWELFEETQEAYRQETLAVFDRLDSLDSLVNG